jgi:hypothetical protein
MSEVIKTITLNKKKDHLVFTVKEFDELGLSTNISRGIKEIAPDRDPDEMLAVATEKYNFALAGEPDNNGLFGVKLLSKKAE